MEGNDEIRGLGDQDGLVGGSGNDFLVGGTDREEAQRLRPKDRRPLLGIARQITSPEDGKGRNRGA
jgi:Ca2+-binding RTX toxin-like protein